MESKGRLDVRVNPRRNVRQPTPSESEPSNEFDQSESEEQSEESYHPPPPPPQRKAPPPQQPPPPPPAPKREQPKELKQSLLIPSPPKNNHQHHQPPPPPPPPAEEKKPDMKRGAQKRRNNFNSFENTTQQQPNAPLAPAPAPLPPPLNPPVSKPSLQEQKAGEITKNMEKLTSSIHELRDDYAQLQKQEAKEGRSKDMGKGKQGKEGKPRDVSPFGVKLSPQKEQEVRQFLTLKQKEKRQRRKMLDAHYQRLQHRLDLEEREKEMLKERERKRRLKELKSMSKFDEKHERWKEEHEEKQKQAQQFIKKYENEVKFHLRKLDQDRQKQKKRLQKERELLKERKDFYKSIDAAELEQHQKWYEDKLYELQREKQDAKEEEAQRIAEENAALNEMWRGQSHGFVEEELQQLRKKKREPKEKARRIRQYKQHVKKNFLPKPYLSNQSNTIQPRQSSNDSRLSHREVKRYRYYKGNAYGQVIQTLPLVKDHHQRHQLGNNYLQFMKSLPKRREPVEQEEQLMLDPEEIEILERKFNSVGKVRREQHSLYDEGRRKKTAIEVPSNPTRDDLKMIALQLKAHDQKLRQKQQLLNYQQHGKVDHVHGQQKAINQGLVQNIQRKLSLLAQI